MLGSPSLRQYGGISLLASLLLSLCAALSSQEVPSAANAIVASPDPERLSQTLAGLKRTERAMYLYERIEKTESRKNPRDAQPEKVKVSRVIPAGTGIDRIPLGVDGKPPDLRSYRAEMEKLERSLEWATGTGHAQKDAYEKVEKKLKQNEEVIDATRSAFLFTLLGREDRDGRTLLKYRMEPNPAFKPNSRATSFFSKLRGVAWIDEASSQLARIDSQVIEDISFGIFLAKIYKGSHFMQERYEVAPGLWLPTFSQFDFDGRKLFSSISIHEKTFYSNYQRVGPPAEALPVIRAELARLKSDGAGASAPSSSDP